MLSDNKLTQTWCLFITLPIPPFHQSCHLYGPYRRPSHQLGLLATEGEEEWHRGSQRGGGGMIKIATRVLSSITPRSATERTSISSTHTHTHTFHTSVGVRHDYTEFVNAAWAVGIFSLYLFYRCYWIKTKQQTVARSIIIQWRRQWFKFMRQDIPLGIIGNLKTIQSPSTNKGNSPPHSLKHKLGGKWWAREQLHRAQMHDGPTVVLCVTKTSELRWHQRSDDVSAASHHKHAPSRWLLPFCPVTLGPGPHESHVMC